MSVLDKLQFWKRKDEFSESSPAPGVGSPIPEEFGGMHETPPHDFGFSPAQEQFGSFGPSQPSSFPQQQTGDVSKDLQLISAKLDTIKTLLDVVNQRLDRLDKQKGEDVVRWR